MALYLQATQNSAECCNSFGLAIRVAQSLGLDVEGGKDRLLSSRDLNLRRQVWHLCVQMDRYVHLWYSSRSTPYNGARLFSITYGPPLMIDNTVVSLPQIIEDEHVLVSTDILGSDSAISKYGAFVQFFFCSVFCDRQSTIRTTPRNY